MEKPPTTWFTGFVCTLAFMKKPKLLLLSGLVAIGLFSCSKKGSASFEITVTDGRTGNASNGAIIKLYPDSAAVVNNDPKYTKTTDKSGKAKFSVSYLAKYYVIVQNGNEKNLYDGSVPIGIFKSQQEVNNYPIQTPPGVAGRIIFRDINGDGKMDHYDKVVAPVVDLSLDYTRDIKIF
jgi:hypothetical protein